mgnify:CR=1 FL=1
MQLYLASALHSPPPLLVRMVEEGRLGKKVGHGFFRYDAPRATARRAF